MTNAGVTRWLFEASAGLYAWMTAQPPWRDSCRRLMAGLPLADHTLRIVDLGCGAGSSTLELSRHRPHDSVVGVDFAGRMLRCARRRARGAGLDEPRLTWVRTDAAHLPFRANSVDAITGHSVLYLLPDRDAVLQECLRVLRPGGRILVMEPNERPVRVRDVVALSADPRFLLSIALWRPISRLYGRFAPASLEAVLRTAGFAGCEVSEAMSGLGLCASGHKA